MSHVFVQVLHPWEYGQKGRIANVTNSIICLHQCSTKGKRWPMHWMFDLLWSQVMRKSSFLGYFFAFLNLFMYWQLGKFLGMAVTSIGTAWAEHPRPIGLVDNVYFFIAQGPQKDVWSKKRQISKRQTPVRLLSLPRQALTLRWRQTGGQLHKQSYVTHTFSSRGLSWCCTWQTCFQFFLKNNPGIISDVGMVGLGIGRQ